MTTDEHRLGKNNSTPLSVILVSEPCHIWNQLFFQQLP